MNVATLDAELARSLRLMLQGEHLGLANDDDLFAVSRFLGQQMQSTQERERGKRVLHHLQDTLSDPHVALQMMHERAWDNLRRYKAKQPLVGHLLPYLTAGEAQQEGLNFRDAHGWLEEP